jgi:hypothetical protein
MNGGTRLRTRVAATCFAAVAALAMGSTGPGCAGAAESIAVSPSVVEGGAQITIVGTGWTCAADVDIFIEDGGPAARGLVSWDDIVDGGFSVVTAAPNESGDYDVIAEYGNAQTSVSCEGRANDPFTVVVTPTTTTVPTPRRPPPRPSPRPRPRRPVAPPPPPCPTPRRRPTRRPHDRRRRRAHHDHDRGRQRRAHHHGRSGDGRCPSRVHDEHVLPIASSPSPRWAARGHHPPPHGQLTEPHPHSLTSTGDDVNRSAVGSVACSRVRRGRLGAIGIPSPRLEDRPQRDAGSGDARRGTPTPQDATEGPQGAGRCVCGRSPRGRYAPHLNTRP